MLSILMIMNKLLFVVGLLTSQILLSQELGPVFTINSDYTTITDIEMADIDGDGDLDLVRAGGTDYPINWVENIDNFTVEGETHDIGLNEEVELFTAKDLDGDNLPDIATVSDLTGELAIYLNLGDGDFTEKIVLLDIFNYPEFLLCEDLNNDGLNDLIVYTWISDDIIYFENLGEGNFSPSVAGLGLNAVTDISVGDFNSDGLKDIIVSRYSPSESIYLIESLGDSEFSTPGLIYESPGIDRMQVFDFNLDGNEDICTMDALNHSSEIILGDGEGNFDFEIEFTINISSNLSFFGAVDLNLDGYVDVIDNGGPTNPCYYLNVSGTHFQANTVNEELSDVSILHFVSHGDINQDGIEDLIFCNQDGVCLWVRNDLLNGCMDEEACNFDPEALYDDSSCCYGNCGCMDIDAYNFNSSAECDFGCLYDIEGIIYFDENENSLIDWDELGISNHPIELTNNSDGLTITGYTDAEGEFHFVNLLPGDYTISTDSTDEYPFIITDSSSNHQFPEEGDNGTTEFGLSNEEPIYQVFTSLFGSIPGVLCNSIVDYCVYVENTGSEPMDIRIEIIVDTLYGDVIYSEEMFSLEGDTITYYLDYVAPGTTIPLCFLVQGPDESNIGETASIDWIVTGEQEGEILTLDESTLYFPIICAYDPNDKLANPIGHQEEHYILQDTDLTYKIRFQNTGNAPATNINIADTLDSKFDFDSFQFESASHSVFTTFNPENGAINFFFENIMLPDSMANEPESHGYIIFKVKPRLDEIFEHDEQILNTAYIYFDNNPPIVTNTAYHSFFDCDEHEPIVEYEDGLLSTHSAIFYQWYENGQEIDGANGQTLENPNEESYYSVETWHPLGCVAISGSLFIPLGIEDYC